MNDYKIAGIHIAFSHVYERFFKDNLEQYAIDTDAKAPYRLSTDVTESIEKPSLPLKYTYKNRHVHGDDTHTTIVSYTEEGTIRQRIDQENDLSCTKIYLSPLLGDRLDELEYVLTGLYFFEIAIQEDRFPLHASAITHQSEAILFSGPSGVGKSTHTAYWQKLFGPLAVINDDKPLLHEEDGKLHVSGTPFSGKDSISHNITRPIKAILFLKQGKENALHTLAGKDSLKHLLRNTFRPGKPHLSDKLFTLCETIIETVPIYEATVTHSEASAKYIHDRLYEEAHHENQS